jgi:hypothetical protein
MPLSAAKIEDNTTKANVFYLLLTSYNYGASGADLL